MIITAVKLWQQTSWFGHGFYFRLHSRRATNPWHKVFQHKSMPKIARFSISHYQKQHAELAIFGNWSFFLAYSSKSSFCHIQNCFMKTLSTVNESKHTGLMFYCRLGRGNFPKTGKKNHYKTFKYFVAVILREANFLTPVMVILLTCQYSNRGSTVHLGYK